MQQHSERKEKKNSLKKKKIWGEKALSHRNKLDKTSSAILNLCEIILRKEYGITDEILIQNGINPRTPVVHEIELLDLPDGPEIFDPDLELHPPEETSN